MSKKYYWVCGFTGEWRKWSDEEIKSTHYPLYKITEKDTGETRYAHHLEQVLKIKEYFAKDYKWRLNNEYRN